MSERTMANFKGIREQVGMTQSALADAMGVEVRSVKRWESPNAPQVPPDEAWAILGAAKAAQDRIVEEAV